MRELHPAPGEFTAPAPDISLSFVNAGRLPLVAQALAGQDLIAWAKANAAWIHRTLPTVGGILFRGFDGSGGPSRLEELIQALSGDPLEYRERSSPRSQVTGNIYTSTDYPAHQRIFLHNENSYQRSFPKKIFFCCLQPAARGGETPLADIRKVFGAIEPPVREKFLRQKVMYVRNFRAPIGIPWRTVFQTEDRAAVQRYCEDSGIQCEWIGPEHLRTRQVRPAVAWHPDTGEAVWFNHAAFFHITSLPAEVQSFLLGEYGEADLPTHSFYGDGERIEESAMRNVQEAYHKNTVEFPWQQDDVLLLDNMLVAHGRNPFSGSRKVVVGMAEPYSLPPENRSS